MAGLVSAVQRGGEASAGAAAAYAVCGLATHAGDREGLVRTAGLVQGLLKVSHDTLHAMLKHVIRGACKVVQKGDKQSRSDAVCAFWELMQHDGALALMANMPDLVEVSPAIVQCRPVL